MFESMLGRRLLFSVATAIACALIVTPAIGTERRQDLGRELVGSWRLVSFVVRNASGSTVAYPFGDDAVGKLTYTADGNAWALVRAKSSQAVLWYTGTFQIDPRRVGAA
jgi:Lipocalin-like domain